MSKEKDQPDLNLLRWVMDYIEANCSAPTLRDIGDEFGLSLRGAELRLMRLQDEGYIELDRRRNRGIVVTHNDRRSPVRLEFVSG